MGYFDDLNTILKTMASAKQASSKYAHKSIARGALDGTMQFPCLISDAIPVDMASTIARTLERVYASFIQTYLSTNNTIDISVDKNPNMFLKRFHHNIKVESTVEDLYHEHCIESDEEYDKLMERIYDGTTVAYVSESENKMFLFNFSDKFNSSVYESHKELLEEAMASIDFKPFPNVGNSPFYYEAIGNGDLDTYAITKGMDYAYDRRLNDIKNAQSLDLQRMKDSHDMDKEKFKLRQTTSVPTLLKDTDVKKSNELQPYLMQLKLMAINDHNEFVQFLEFVVGVKVILHTVKSDEMIINLQNVLQNNGALFNFIRWTTGEKSLFKDILLHINDTKLDAANKSKGASPWWSTLKRLKETSRAQAAFFSRTQLVPQSTIVISAFEADSIEKNYGYNLRNPRFAVKLMQSLFLMNFVIVDEGTGTIDVLYDGETAYQKYSLETLEREVTMNSNKIGKELTRMISR